MVKLRSIINSLYGQVAGDLETCSRLGATRFTTAVNKFPSPLPRDRTTNSTDLFAFPRTSNSPCPSVDSRTVRSKTVFIGRQQRYAVPARSTVGLQVAILALPMC